MGNLSRLFFTIISLKLKQILFQIYYKVKFRKLNHLIYSQYFNWEIHKLTFKLSQHYKIQGKCKENGIFSFLNQTYEFKNSIDWDFNAYGKLWNYNLQYLDYILDDNLELEYRRDLIQKISISIINGELMLEPYPVSLRINNLILFDSIYGLNNQEIYKALKLQIDFLSSNLEYHLLANHLLENYITLFLASYALKDNKLNYKISRLLESELDEQIFDDGGHFERSPMYHCIILQRLMLCIDVIESNEYFNNKIILKNIKQKSALMLGWLDSFSFNDGSWPLVNDSAGNISLSKSEIEEIAKSLNLKMIQTNLQSSGFRKLKSKNFEILVNVGPITPQYQPGHAHSDMLSFYLWDGKKQLIIDTGVSTYDNNQFRSEERSTKLHNTITICNNNQSDVWGGFRVGKKAKLLLNVDEKNMLSAEVYDMHGLSSNTKHKRNFIISNDILLVEDLVLGEKSEIISRIHFDCDVKPIINGGTVDFENFYIKYCTGLNSLKIESFEQAITFNHKKISYRLVSSVDNFSSFIISKKI